MAAATKVAIATVIGATAGLVLMVASPATATCPTSGASPCGSGSWDSVQSSSPSSTGTTRPLPWRPLPLSASGGLVTGMDGCAEKVAESVAGSSPSLSPTSAGTGAFGGVSSTPYPGSGSAAWPRCSSAWFSGSCPPFWRASLGAGTTSRAKTAPPQPAGIAPTRRGGVGAQNRRPATEPPRSHPITVDPEGKRCLSPKAHVPALTLEGRTGLYVDGTGSRRRSTKTFEVRTPRPVNRSPPSSTPDPPTPSGRWTRPFAAQDMWSSTPPRDRANIHSAPLPGFGQDLPISPGDRGGDFVAPSPTSRHRRAEGC